MRSRRVARGQRGIGRVPWLAFAVSIGLAGGAGVLLALNHASLRRENPFNVWTPYAGVLAYGVVGALVTARLPRHAIGRLFRLVALVNGATLLAQEYAVYGLVTRPASVPGARWAALAQSFGSPVSVWVVTVAALLYPTGALLSRRWRAVVTVATAGMSSTILMTALGNDQIGPAFRQVRLSTPSPLLVVPLSTGLAWLVLTLLTVLPLLAAALGVAIRYRRSGDVERHQLTWVLWAAGVSIAPLPLSGLGVPYLRDLNQVGALMLMVGLPACAAVAILRYRLWDIDRLVARTVSYFAVSALLGAVYASAALLLGALVAGSGLVVAAATLAVAGLFRPVRDRVQRAVDRRFNRTRYDAAVTVERFAATLRDRVDLGDLRADLTSTARTVVQPSVAALWLRDAG